MRIAILATPRSGSTLFCRQLENHFLAGSPKELLSPRSINQVFPGFRGFDLPTYMEDIQSDSPDGVLSVKLLVNQVAWWQKNGVRLSDFGFNHVVWIERRDKLQQAISLAKAKESGVWVKFDKSSDSDQTNGLGFSAIANSLADLVTQLEFFSQNLASQVLASYMYEDFQDSLQAANDAARLMGLKPRIDNKGVVAEYPLVQRTPSDLNVADDFIRFLSPNPNIPKPVAE